VLQNCQKISEYLFKQLREMKGSSNIISDVRGRGLLIGLEFVKDKEKDILFEPNQQISNRINEMTIDMGAVFYPGSGGIDGLHGEHLLVSPPLNIGYEAADELLDILKKSIEMFEKKLIKDS